MTSSDIWYIITAENNYLSCVCFALCYILHIYKLCTVNNDTNYHRLLLLSLCATGVLSQCATNVQFMIEIRSPYVSRRLTALIPPMTPPGNTFNVNTQKKRSVSILMQNPPYNMLALYNRAWGITDTHADMHMYKYLFICICIYIYI